jgi:hypothetical protein
VGGCIPRDHLNPAALSTRYELPEAVDWNFGGQGRVCRATHVELNQPVALKVARDDRPQAASRIQAEGRILARLHHPNIITVYDLFEWDGRVCLAMEYAEGSRLDNWPPERVSGGVRKAVELVAQLAGGVMYAHGQGMMHRDIKPKNVLLDHHGTPRLIDFGLSVQVDRTNADVRGGAGTPRYMAPEQASSDRVTDFRTDVYGLAATLFALVTGRAPFSDVPDDDVDRAVREDVPQLLPGIRLPPDLVAVIRKGMAKRPDDRYQSAKDLREDLRRFLNGEPVRARRQWVSRRVALWGRRNKAGATIIGLLLLVTTVSIAGLVWVDWLFNRTVAALADQVTFLARTNPSPSERLDALAAVNEFAGVPRRYAPRQKSVRRLNTSIGVTRASLLAELDRRSEAAAEIDRTESELKATDDAEAIDRARPAIILVRANLAIKSGRLDEAAAVIDDYLSRTAARRANRTDELLVSALMIELRRAARSPADRAAVAEVTRRYLATPATDDFSVASGRCEVLLLSARAEFPGGNEALGRERVRAAAELASHWLARRPNDREAITLAWRTSAAASWDLMRADEKVADDYAAAAARLAPRANRASDPMADMILLARSSLRLASRNEPPPADAAAVVTRLEAAAAEAPTVLNVSLLLTGYSLLAIRAELTHDLVSVAYWQSRELELLRSPPGDVDPEQLVRVDAMDDIISQLRETRRRYIQGLAVSPGQHAQENADTINKLLFQARVLTHALSLSKMGEPAQSRNKALDRHLILTLLEAAELMGFRDAEALVRDKYLAPLRLEPRFRQLLERLRMSPAKK